MVMQPTKLIISSLVMLTNTLGHTMENFDSAYIHKMLNRENHSGNFDVQTGNAEDNTSEYISINGNGFISANALSNLPVKVLSLENTRIKTLAFFNKGVITSTLIHLFLSENKQLTDYTSLAYTKIRNLHITNEPNFNDTTLINPDASSIYLINTSIEKLCFSHPQNIKNLSLALNHRLNDCSQIKKLSNLFRLELDCVNEVDLSSLMKLKNFTLQTQAPVNFPILPAHNMDYICLFNCDKLLSLNALTGKDVRRLVFISSQDQLERFSPVLMTMEISELEVLDHDTTIATVEKLKGIKGLQKIRFNDKQLLKIDKKWNTNWIDYETNTGRQ